VCAAPLHAHGMAAAPRARAGVPGDWASAAAALLSWLADHAAAAALPAHLSGLPGACWAAAPGAAGRGSTGEPTAGADTPPKSAAADGGRAGGGPALACCRGAGGHARAAARFLSGLAAGGLPRLWELAAAHAADRDDPAAAGTDPGRAAVAEAGASAAAELAGLVGLCGPPGAGAASLESLFRLACAPGRAQGARARAAALLRRQGAVLTAGAPRLGRPPYPTLSRLPAALAWRVLAERCVARPGRRASLCRVKRSRAV